MFCWFYKLRKVDLIVFYGDWFGFVRWEYSFIEGIWKSGKFIYFWDKGWVIKKGVRVKV